jgi:hypothetical protein
VEPRALRVKVSNIDARFGKHVVQLLDLSATGALIATNTAVPVGSEWALQLEADGIRLPLKARVVRVVNKTSSPDPSTTTAGEWLAGVTFVGLSPSMMTAITRLALGHSTTAEAVVHRRTHVA